MSAGTEQPSLKYGKKRVDLDSIIGGVNRLGQDRVTGFGEDPPKLGEYAGCVLVDGANPNEVVRPCELAPDNWHSRLPTEVACQEDRLDIGPVRARKSREACGYVVDVESELDWDIFSRAKRMGCPFASKDVRCQGCTSVLPAIVVMYDAVLRLENDGHDTDTVIRMFPKVAEEVKQRDALSMICCASHACGKRALPFFAARQAELVSVRKLETIFRVLWEMRCYYDHYVKLEGGRSAKTDALRKLLVDLGCDSLNSLQEFRTREVHGRQIVSVLLGSPFCPLPNTPSMEAHLHEQITASLRNASFIVVSEYAFNQNDRVDPTSAYGVGFHGLHSMWGVRNGRAGEDAYFCIMHHYWRSRSGVFSPSKEELAANPGLDPLGLYGRAGFPRLVVDDPSKMDFFNPTEIRKRLREYHAQNVAPQFAVRGAQDRSFMPQGFFRDLAVRDAILDRDKPKGWKVSGPDYRTVLHPTQDDSGEERIDESCRTKVWTALRFIMAHCGERATVNMHESWREAFRVAFLYVIPPVRPVDYDRRCHDRGDGPWPTSGQDPLCGFPITAAHITKVTPPRPGYVVASVKRSLAVDCNELVNLSEVSLHRNALRNAVLSRDPNAPHIPGAGGLGTVLSLEEASGNDLLGGALEKRASERLAKQTKLMELLLERYEVRKHVRLGPLHSSHAADDRARVLESLAVLKAAKYETLSFADEAHRPDIVKAMQTLDEQREKSSRSDHQWFDPPVGFATLVNQFVCSVDDGKNNPTRGIAPALVRQARMSLVHRNSTQPGISAAMRHHLLNAPGPSAGIRFKRRAAPKKRTDDLSASPTSVAVATIDLGPITSAPDPKRLRLSHEYFRSRDGSDRLGLHIYMDDDDDTNKSTSVEEAVTETCFNLWQFCIWSKVLGFLDAPINSATKKQHFKMEMQQGREDAQAYEDALRAETTKDPQRHIESVQLILDHLADLIPASSKHNDAPSLVSEKKGWGNWHKQANSMAKKMAAAIVAQTLASRAAAFRGKRVVAAC